MRGLGTRRGPRPRLSWVIVVRWLDEGAGGVLLGDGLRVDPGWDHGAFAASRLAEGASRRSDWFRPADRRIGGRPAELWLLLRRTLLEVRIRLLPGGGRGLDDEGILARDMRHWTWLGETLGAPTHRNPRGALYTFGWGWVHAGGGAIHVSYAGDEGALPLPDAPGPRGAYRCSACGEVALLPYGGAPRATRRHGGAPCPRCGAVHWSRVDDGPARPREDAR